MRSRYTAFVRGDVAYLERTWLAADRPARLQLDGTRRWTGLTVLATIGGALFDAEGTVEFEASYEGGVQREQSRFVRQDGRWLYAGTVSGQGLPRAL